VECIYRHDLPALRDSLRKLGAVVAEIDRDLRYVWIDNPHPDFDAATVLGRRDDEIIGPADAAPIIRFKREAWKARAPSGCTLRFLRSDGDRAYTMMAYPIVNEGGELEALLTVGFDVAGG
jgi:hypothetical protein